jgi:SSS family transporter
MLSFFETSILFSVFAIFMIGFVWFHLKKEKHAEGFLVADRNLGMWQGAFSIAVSWVWAPAIFICALQAYTKGLPGIFWFTAPNILCFFLFSIVALKIRKLMPNGYSLPDFIHHRFQGHKGVHLSFLFLALAYQTGAIVINAVAGGALLHLASGIDIRIAIVSMVGLAFVYSYLSGLKASVFTDVIQMSMILIFGFILVPWAIFVSGGFGSVTKGFAGITGEFGNVFDPKIAFAMGIPLTLSLLAGPITDQMFYQRAMAVQKDKITKVFIFGGLIFGVVPILLSLLGFVGVSLTNDAGLMVADPQMVSPLVIQALLPKFAIYLFILMAFAGLCSTMDSAFCAISSLGAVDIFRRYFNKKPTDEQLLKAARLFMVAGAILGGGIALMQPKLLWVFFIYGAVAGAGLFPAIFALFWDKIQANDLFIAIVSSVIIGLPFSVYANITESDILIVVSSVFSVSIGAIICLLRVWLRKA